LTHVQKLGWIYGLRKQNGPSYAAYICSMPHKALYGYAWDYSYLQTSTCYSQRFHIPTEMKPVFITKQNECEVCCSCVHPVKVPVHKIHFCFTTCFIKHVKLICLAVTAAVAVVLQLLAVTQTHTHWLFKSCQKFSWKCRHSGFNFVQFFLGYPLPSVLFYSPKSNVLSETFLLIYNSFHCVEWVQGIFFLLNYKFASCSNCICQLYRTDLSLVSACGLWNSHLLL